MSIFLMYNNKYVDKNTNFLCTFNQENMFENNFQIVEKLNLSAGKYKPSSLERNTRNTFENRWVLN